MSKKKVLFLFSLSVFLILTSGCFDPPEFSDVPEIKFKSIRFVEVEGASDTLELSFEFQDGNGDIGLSSNDLDLQSPYHSLNEIRDSDNNQVFFGNPEAVRPPLFVVNPWEPDDRTLFSNTYNPPPYNTRDWLIREAQGDTVMVIENEFNKNIRIDLLRKAGGQYVLINDELFEDFDSRIPIFDQESLLQRRALSGTINYAMQSQAFPIIFRNDTIKLRFFIYDRALNKSNVEETPDFVLSDIQ